MVKVKEIPSPFGGGGRGPSSLPISSRPSPTMQRWWMAVPFPPFFCALTASVVW